MGETATAQQVRMWRMTSLLLDAPAERSPLEVARWFGALQAQDAASGHWSLGLRCAGLTETNVLDAFERADVVRTWPMRGTIHIVPAQDVRWMLDLTGVRALNGIERRRAQLGLTLADAERAAVVLADALRGSRLLTRAEALAALADAGFDVAGQRSYHLLWFAAQIGVTCIGPQRGSDQTFALLEDWAPHQVSLSRDEALAELLLRFVRSHGPVSLQDFAGWTGLTLGDARRAAALNDGRLLPLATEAGELWATGDLAATIVSREAPALPVVALPGFDEYLLGYKDRRLQLPAGAMERVVPGNNGMFRATVVADGLTVGVWTRTLTPTRVRIDVEPLTRWPARLRRQVEAAFEPYARFLGRTPEVRITG